MSHKLSKSLHNLLAKASTFTTASSAAKKSAPKSCHRLISTTTKKHHSKNTTSVSAFFFDKHTTDFSQQQQQRLFTNTFRKMSVTPTHLTPDYQKRSSTFGFADKDVLEKMLQSNSLYILDVRTDQEIQEQGSFTPPKQHHAQCKHVPCTPSDATELTKQIQSGMFGNDKDAPIIVLCKSGRRASTADAALKECGYTNVVNAGGYDDIVAMGLDSKA